MNGNTFRILIVTIAFVAHAQRSEANSNPAAPTVTNAAEGSGAGVDWRSYGRAADATHYSPLDQINDGNIGQVGLAWFVDLPNFGGSGAPLAINGVVYYPTGLSEVHAVDGATGRALWSYQPDPAVASVVGDKLKSGWGLRGIGYSAGKIYAGTQDGRLFALDALTGRLVWSVQTTRVGDGNVITGPPTTFGNKVIIGNSGSDSSYTRGYVTAYEVDSGKQVWRFYTVPGDPSKGFENALLARAAKTWKGAIWKHGAGGSPWNSMTYDRELNRVYIGTGNGGPWNQRVRSPGGGDNLFTCSIIALDADTGRYIWHYQTTPGDSWDYDSANDIELSTLVVDGRRRRVILHAPKNGFFYVIDRETGKLISAKPFAKVTWAREINLKTGRPVENPDARYANGHVTVWPFPNGAHGWQPMSFSPQTGLVYIPTTDMPGDYADDKVDVTNWHRSRGVYFDGGTDFPLPGEVAPKEIGSYGSLEAWNPVRQELVWRVIQQGPENGGVMSTAGNLVFEGQADGKFVAFAADTGKVLWEFYVQNGILNPPITYMHDGKQFISIVANFTGTAGIFGPLSAQFGWDYRTQPRRMLTFALGGTAVLPARSSEVASVALQDDSMILDPGKVAAGFSVYSRHCFLCHGIGAIAGGTAPDLRKSEIPMSAKAFESVLRGGMLKSRGMPEFSELSPNELDEIRQYIRSEARKAPH